MIEVPVNESIILNLSSGSSTRAADEDYESYINHLDVLIFEVGSDNKPAGRKYHEKFVVGNAASVTLSAKRSDFGSNVKYFVYLIANSSLNLSTIDNFSKLNDLKQEDKLIYLSALNLQVDNPKYFLMDAVAKGTDGNSPVVLNDGNVGNDTVLSAVLKRAAAKVRVNIKAQDKVKFMPYTMEQGSEGGLYYIRNLPYDTYILAETKAAKDILTAKLWTTDKTDSEYFTWNPETEYGSKNVSLVAYVYPHHWENASILEKETCIVMNLPMEYNDGADNTVAYHNSWYKIPMTNNSTFERNHYYEINIQLNRPGAISESEPVKVENLHYSVMDWTSVEVNAGGGVDADYLQLNTDHVDIYNANTDSKSLTYASSSEIAQIELLEAYYYNYLDVKTNVDSGVDISAVAESGVLNGGITIYSQFVSKTEAEIQAEIAKLEVPTVGTEPVAPENPEKTKPDAKSIVDKYNMGMSANSRGRIAYKGEEENVEFYAVSRNPNATATENIKKAQTEYNQAWAEYLEWQNVEDKDAAKAEYEAKKAAYDEAKAIYDGQIAALKAYNEKVEEIYKSSENSHSNAIRYLRFKVKNSTGQEAEFTVNQYPTIYITNKRGYYSYRSDFGGTTYLGAGNPNRSGANWDNGTWSYGSVSSGSYFFGSKVALGSEGNYTINYTYWSGRNRETDNISSLNNPRMYHVHVTATSSTYVVARPALDNNLHTAGTAENAKLVSPSFMIASQLGATLSPSRIEQANSHCEQYVEVGVDGTVYDDWRLPTAAEIDIIIQHQDISDAMAVVLTGSAYYCAYNTDANGNVIYTKATGKSGSQNAVRCIRDAY